MHDPQEQSKQVREAFERAFARPATWVVRAPGRLNLLGSHVDHQEGWVLPGAIDRAVWLAMRPNGERTLRLHALDLGRQGEIDLHHLDPPLGQRPLLWSDYPAGVAWALGEAGYEMPGMDVVYGGDLPREIGLSSSAAVEVAFLMAWRALSGVDMDRTSMARLGRRVENEFLGIASGVMDQFASLHGRRDHLLSLDCRSLEYETIPFPEGLRLLIADSGTRRQLGRSGYNHPQKDCRDATRILRENGWGIGSLRDLAPENLPSVLPLLDSIQGERVEHVVSECARVQQGCDDLKAGDVEAFGRLLNLSHASSRDLWHVSTPELDLLVEAAARSKGCLGARLSGAGLGGCILALVEDESLDSTRSSIESVFESEFGRIPETWTCQISEGAEVFRCA